MRRRRVQPTPGPIDDTTFRHYKAQQPEAISREEGVQVARDLGANYMDTGTFEPEPGRRPGNDKNEPQSPFEGWYRKPGTLSPEDPGRAFYPRDKHELSSEELAWHLDKMIDHGVDAHLSSQLRSAGLPKIPAEQKKDLLNGSWAGRGYDLQTREGQLHHRVHQNLAFGEVHPDTGPTVSWHKPGMCDNSQRAKGSPHSHVDGIPMEAEYWWLSPNGYWQSLCARCVLVDMAVAVENPDLGPVVILPVVHRV